MKIGILTFHNTNNYGTSLQAYALYKYLLNLGNDVQVINYHNNKMQEDLRKAYSIPKGFMNVLKYLLFDSNTMNKRRKGFDDFRNRLSLSGELFSDRNKLSIVCNQYDVIIVGSDQVWNYLITNDDYSYYLDFETSALKCSYAASFGLESIDDLHKKEIVRCLKNYKSISIRENQGIKLLDDMHIEKKELVCDPTFLLEKKEWINITRRRIINSKYLLIYCFGLPNSMIENANKIAKEKDLEIVHIDGSFSMKAKYGWKPMRGLSPEEWLCLFRDADYILTNSFHGTAFSLIFEKPFNVELLPPPAKVNSRLINILNITKLNDRLICSDNFNTNDIDYLKVNEQLLKLKNKSFKYLKEECLSANK